MTEIQFHFTDQCCAENIIRFLREQEHLSRDQRDRLCGEMLMDYLLWVGAGCCVRLFEIERGA